MKPLSVRQTVSALLADGEVCWVVAPWLGRTGEGRALPLHPIILGGEMLSAHCWHWNLEELVRGMSHSHNT